MDYSLISPTLKYDTLAAAIKSRQEEHFHYNFDKNNFEQLLLTLEPGQFRDEIQSRLNSTNEQMAKVVAIHDALMAQVTDQAMFQAALERLAAKEAAQAAQAAQVV